MVSRRTKNNVPVIRTVIMPASLCDELRGIAFDKRVNIGILMQNFISKELARPKYGLKAELIAVLTKLAQSNKDLKQDLLRLRNRAAKKEVIAQDNELTLHRTVPIPQVDDEMVRAIARKYEVGVGVMIVTLLSRSLREHCKTQVK